MADAHAQAFRDGLLAGGECGRLIASRHWSDTSLGPLDAWPQSLRTATSILLRSPVPMVMLWGEDGVMLYNDAYSTFAGGRHPDLLGSKVRDGWPEVAAFNDNVMKVGLAGGTLAYRDQELVLHRHGRPEQVWMNLDYSPVPDESGRPAGVLAVVIETTAQVIADAALRRSEERQRFLLDLADRSRRLSDPAEIVAASTRALGERLGVTRVAYAEIDEAEERAIAIGDWTDGTAAHLPAEVRLDDFGPRLIERLRAGGTLRIKDAALHPDTVDSLPALDAITARAIVSVPLFKDERFVVNLNVHQDRPRAWTDAEVALIEAVAERIWEAVERARAEAELRESEARFRLTADAVPQIVWITDRHGRMEFLNRRFVEYTGAPDGAYEPDEMAAKFMHPDDGAKVVTAFGSALETGKPFEIEHRIRSAAGEDRWFIARAEPYRDPRTGEIIRWFGSSIDIHDRKRAEARLRELNETLEGQVAERTVERDRMWETSPDLMLVIDFDGYLRRVNPAWTAVLGYAPEELVGRHSTEFVLASDHRATIDAYELAAAGGRPEIENRCRHKDGSVRWISWVAAPAGNATYATGRDVTAQKQRQAELAATEAARREADALYRAYFENTAEALFVVNVLEDGGFTIEDLNPAHQASIGLPLAQVRGKRIDEVLPPETAETVILHYRRLIDMGEVYQYRETFDLHGRLTHWDTVLVPVRDGEGRIIRLIGSSRDLTRQMAAEEQLRQAQKMEAMGQLTGGVAHDFNNLLTPIVGSLDLLQRKGVGNERERRLIAGAAQSAERAKTLVQRLLAFARRQPLQATAVDVAGLVTGMADLIGSTTGPQIKVAAEIADDLPPAKGDPNQLEMALLNLAVNARDAMPEGGTLRISASEERVGPGHRAELGAGRYVRLSVADTGIGMDAATLARAVEPFFSTKGIGKGTGLGLSMVHGLAQQLGGALTIQSRRDVGTNVELWLPVSQAPAETSGPAAETASPASAAGTALLVDDEALVRMSTADMLADLGYAVVEAASAEEALRLIRGDLRPDLLVTDHLMPGMNGTELARIVRSEHPDVQVLLVSGYAESEGVAPDLPRLTKPFRSDELAASLAVLRGLAAQ